MSNRGHHQRGGPPRAGAPPHHSARGASSRGGPPSASSRGRGTDFSTATSDSSSSAPGGGRGRGRGQGRGYDRGSFRGAHGAPRGGGPPGPIIFQQNVSPVVPDRLSDPNLKSLVSAFSSFRVKASPERPLRPGYGTLGQPITLRANFFPVRIPKGPYYDYVVDIQGPKSDKTGIKIRIFQLLEQSPAARSFSSHIAHDRSQRLVSAKQLPQPLVVNIPYYDEDEQRPGPDAPTYVVTIKFERELRMDELNRYLDGQPDARSYDLTPLISALNLITQSHAAKTGSRVGRTVPKYFYDKPTAPVSLGPNLEAWQGFTVSVRPAYKQLMVNVNVCMSAFVSAGNLADILFNFNQRSQGAMPTLPAKMVKSIKVKTRHIPRRKKLFQIMTTSARNTRFKTDTGEVSVEQYFKKTYNITLKYPAELPVVNLGTKARHIYVPAELCDVEAGNAFRGRLSDRETASMIRYACNPPRVNAEAITNIGFPSLGFSSPSGTKKSSLEEFGISIDTEMTVIPGRELPPPSLNYKGGNNPRVQNGSWNILNVKFHRAATVHSWSVLVIRDGFDKLQGPDDPALLGLVDGFAAKCRNSGMQIPGTRPTIYAAQLIRPSQDDAARSKALDMIRDRLKRVQGQTFLLVLLEARDNHIYPGLKKIGDVELGIHTLCMQLDKALGDPRKQDQYFSNVALKLNTKLGGVNHQLDDNAMNWLKKKPTMMVGIDVTHAGPTSRLGTPSIAAVVANIDDSFAQFPASMRIQQVDENKESKEMVDELRDMMVERLLAYEKKTGKLPQRIFVFRDGVSEGQFDVCLREELPEILAAFERMGTQKRTKYKPQLSIIICGKRHHARFFSTDSPFADKNGNTRPGTVVDKGVTAIFDFDFYLQAHAGLQGTAKPTHYTVIYDENAFKADEIQKGTHDFSYLYARATKAVSLIPPAYYADLACERGRCYLNDFLVLDDDRSFSVGGSRSSGGGGRRSAAEEKEAVFREAQAVWGDGLHANVRNSMFYI